MRFCLAVVMLLHIVYVSHAFDRPVMTGKAISDVGEVGEHYPLFLIEKSHNPETITVVYTKLDTDCHVLPDRDHGFLPTLGFYWLLNATRYKPMAGPLKAGVRKRLQFLDAHGSHGDPTSFALRTDALSRVQHDIQNPTVQIQAERQGDVCVAIAFMTLGPSNGHATLQVKSISTQTEPITLLKKMQAMADPDAIRIYAVTVKGTDIATGQPLARTYHAAR